MVDTDKVARGCFLQKLGLGSSVAVSLHAGRTAEQLASRRSAQPVAFGRFGCKETRSGDLCEQCDSDRKNANKLGDDQEDVFLLSCLSFWPALQET